MVYDEAKLEARFEGDKFYAPEQNSNEEVNLTFLLKCCCSTHTEMDYGDFFMKAYCGSRKGSFITRIIKSSQYTYSTLSILISLSSGPISGIHCSTT